MNTILDRLEELRAGKAVVGGCPRCKLQQVWGDPARDLGNSCSSSMCGVLLDLDAKPPVILCAVCGEALHRSASGDTAFTCQGCGRRVTA